MRPDRRYERADRPSLSIKGLVVGALLVLPFWAAIVWVAW